MKINVAVQLQNTDNWQSREQSEVLQKRFCANLFTFCTFKSVCLLLYL